NQASLFCVVPTPLPPSSTLVPYTTLFRSRCAGKCLALSHGWAASGHRGQRQPYSLANDTRRARFRHPVGSARRAGGENESRHESNGRFGRGYSSSIDPRRKTKRRCERKAIIFRPVS